MKRKRKCHWCKRIIHRGGIKATAYKASFYQVVVIGKRYFHKICHSQMLINKKRYKQYHRKRGLIR